jgi:hypothetical protein
MLLCVPLPVWNTTSGKWSMSLPEMTCKADQHLRATRGRITDVVGSLLDGRADLRVHAIANIDDGSSLFEYTEGFN